MSTSENTSATPSEEQEVSSGNAAIFDKDELRVLNANRTTRQRLIRSIIGETYKLPEQNADKTVLVQLLSDLDKEVMQRAKLRLASKVNDNMTDIKSVVAEALKQHRPRPSRPTGVRPTLPEHAYDLRDVVPGELDQGMVSLSEKDILQ